MNDIDKKIDDLEITHRDLMRISPAYFANYVSGKKWTPAPHLKLISRAIARAAINESSRVCISLPPRHGKSELCSIWYPFWYLYCFPDRKVVFVSYESDFAKSFGMRVRDMIGEYGGQFGMKIRSDKSAADEWLLETGSGFSMFTTGVGGPLTGKGAHLLIVDDPIKNNIDANSPTMRKNLWEWWVSTSNTRMEPGGSQVIIHTRWHEDDLIGKLLQTQENDPLADQYENIVFKAIAEEEDVLGRQPGEALWPARYDVSRLLKIKATSAYNFATLFQQSPGKREGSIFDSNNITWINPQDLPSKFDYIVRHWDLAATEKEKGLDPDWSVGFKLAVKDGLFFILDIVRKQLSPAKLEDLVKETAERDGKKVHIHFEQEPGSSGKITVDHYKRVALSGYSTSSDRSTGSKIENAALAASAVENGFVTAVIALWNKDFKKELDTFPYDKHDDQVDGFSGAYNKIVSRRKKKLDGFAVAQEISLSVA